MVMDEEIDLDALKTYGMPDILICVGNQGYTLITLCILSF